MKYLLSVFACAAMLSMAGTKPAVALSCAPPTLDAASIEAATLIFEGRVAAVAVPQIPAGQDIKTKGGTVADLKAYVFDVTHPWKGVGAGEQAVILRNTYWGDGFAEGHEYLIVAEQEAAGLNIARLCGPSVPLATDFAKAMQETLRAHYGEPAAPEQGAEQ